MWLIKQLLQYQIVLLVYIIESQLDKNLIRYIIIKTLEKFNIGVFVILVLKLLHYICFYH